ncbi:MAG: trehalose-phosphatase [Gammaproteobacteria bacterium]
MLPAPDLNDALFLDFDGTLVEFAPRPDAVRVPAELIALLENLRSNLADAVAVVSGRPIMDLDHLLAPLQFAAAGEHGAEIRATAQADVEFSSPLPEAAATAIGRLGKQLPGTFTELKTSSASLHYRSAPEHADAVRLGMQEVVEQVDGYALLGGKMVVEFKLEHINKGVAIRELASRPPFAGRRPVFIGDDVTDEAGFVAVNELGGVSIRVVGAGEETQTEARYRIGSVGEVYNWLARLV